MCIRDRSQIASEIEYYTVGDARFTVTQAIELPDSNAFITFNNPRIYYRKQGIPSKRYGFKALAYKWNNEMNGQNMFYDKKTTRMYVALSGKTQETRRTGTDSIPVSYTHLLRGTCASFVYLYFTGKHRPESRTRV